MPACRALIGDALAALKAVAPGDDPTADELAAGMAALAAIIGDLHEARGPLTDIDVTADYVAGENQRVRVQAGFTVDVTLPNAVWIAPGFDPYDFGFAPPIGAPMPGSTASADGITLRAPRDGTRIEIVGVTQGLYFYRADVNQWLAAGPLSLDGEAPLNARYASAVSALVAERLLDMLPNLDEPTPILARRIAAGNAALMLRSGTACDPVRGTYF